MKNLINKLKSGKRNKLKYQNKNARINYANDITPAEREYVYHEIVSNMSKEEFKKGFAYRQLYNEKDKKYYMYKLIYDKDGMHGLKRYEVVENKYD